MNRPDDVACSASSGPLNRGRFVVGAKHGSAREQCLRSEYETIQCEKSSRDSEETEPHPRADQILASKVVAGIYH